MASRNRGNRTIGTAHAPGQATSAFDDLQGFQPFTTEARSIDWKDGERVVGVIEGFDTLFTENGERHVMLLLTPSGEHVMVWENVALRRLFTQLSVGDEVAIVAKGVLSLPGGRKMRQFDVAVKRHSPPRLVVREPASPVTGRVGRNPDRHPGEALYDRGDGRRRNRNEGGDDIPL